MEFNQLEFNLYELLNLSLSCSTEDVKKKFKKLIKKFHPDKITELEEKLYYNITLAHRILSNQETKDKYDNWLLKSHTHHSMLKQNFKEDVVNLAASFPKTQKEAQVEFSRTSGDLAKRHGNFDDNRKLATIYKEKESIRNKMPNIVKEDYNDMKDFNKKFAERKTTGVYSNQIVKSNKDITPFVFGSNKYTELKNTDNVYLKDDTLNYAFSLVHIEEIDYGEDSKMEELTRKITTTMNFDDI